MNEERKDEEYRRLVLELEDEDPAAFLSHLRLDRSRGIVQDHLEQFLVCAGLHSRPEIIDALVALDPRGKEGFALCAVSQYGQPATVGHLLDEGFLPARAHRPSGQSCEPLAELAAGSSASAPCSGDFEQFVATPTAAGCKHRAEVAALLIEAGASSGGALPLHGCTREGGLGSNEASDSEDEALHGEARAE